MAEHTYSAAPPNCDCEDAESHSPCAECGAGRDAYQHLTPSVEQQVEDVFESDAADGSDANA